MTNRTSAAVYGDQPGCIQCILTYRTANLQMDLIPMILHLEQFVAETDLEKRAAHQVLDRDVAEMELFAL